MGDTGDFKVIMAPPDASVDELLSKLHDGATHIATMWSRNSGAVETPEVAKAVLALGFQVSHLTRLAIAQSKAKKDFTHQQQKEYKELREKAIASEKKVEELEGLITALKQQHAQDLEAQKEALTKAHQEALDATIAKAISGCAKEKEVQDLLTKVNAVESQQKAQTTELKAVAKAKDLTDLRSQVTDVEKKMREAAKAKDLTQLKKDVTDVKANTQAWTTVVSRSAKTMEAIDAAQRGRNLVISGVQKPAGTPLQTAAQLLYETLGVDKAKVQIANVRPLTTQQQAEKKGSTLLVTLGAEVQKGLVYRELHKLAKTEFNCVSVNDDLTRENRLKRDVLLLKRRDLAKGEAGAGRARVVTVNMHPVLVVFRAGQWIEMVPAQTTSTMGEWDPKRWDKYEWKQRTPPRQALPRTH